MRRCLTVVLVTMSALPAMASECGIDPQAVEARINELEPRYGTLLSDIGCDLPRIPAHVLLCDAAERPDPSLWRMARLDDLAWAYAVENATGQEIDLSHPPRDPEFLAARDACTDTDCLCSVLIDHTDASLGGTSPYRP